MATFTIRTKLDTYHLKMILFRGSIMVILYIIVALIVNLTLKNRDLALVSIFMAPIILSFPIIKIIESIRLLYQPDEMEIRIINDIIQHKGRFIGFKVPLRDIEEIIELPRDYNYRLGKKNFQDLRYKAEIPAVGYSNPFGIIMKKDVRYYILDHERTIDRMVLCDDEKQSLKKYLKKRYRL